VKNETALTIVRRPSMPRHDKMVGLVERMLELHKKLPKAKNPQKQESTTVQTRSRRTPTVL
jgi:hypothetical protein